MEQMEQNTFVIDNDSKADWAVQQILEAQAERDRLQALCDEQIAALKDKRQELADKCEKETAWLRGSLMAYMETVKTKETKTQASYQLLSGKLVKKFAKPDFVHDDECLYAYAKQHEPAFIRVKESFDWAAFKKHLHIVDGVIVNADGEVVEIDGLEIVEKPATFSIV